MQHNTNESTWEWSRSSLFTEEAPELGPYEVLDYPNTETAFPKTSLNALIPAAESIGSACSSMKLYFPS